ncbi:type IV pilus biogenesis/stability protein PilW [Colwellia piezophila]|uniref:type IV pilus biogenesis/stability protein PilW n=1 Tax=Colwellia piezophila TaxID=211668 RepID=UPI0012F77597|nr:type IV pilus biogenesis/stability protein PilW [Colwellia piezophila]
MAKYILLTLTSVIFLSLLSGCVTQSFENNEPIVRNQATLNEMATTRVALGLGYLQMGDMSQAKLNLEKAKGFSPNLVQVHTAFAHYYETVGESELAITSFELALSIKADSADTLNNYGVFLCRQDKVDAAEVQFLKAIAVPSYLLVSQTYENLASCYLQSDDFDKAEMYLKKAIAHDPNRTAPLLQMVRLQYAMTDYKDAKLFLQKFERNTLRFTADSLALAYKVYWKLGQRRTAGNYANMLMKMYPRSWEGKQFLLNELEFIEADNLADKYRLSQKEKNRYLVSTSHKRVVKLSPKKIANSPYTNSNLAAIPTSNSTVASKPETVASSTNSLLGSGTALLSVGIAGTVVANNLPVTKTAMVSTTGLSNAGLSTTGVNNTGVKNIPVASNTAANVVKTILLTSSVVVGQSDSDANEPTSTKPIPATRDVPLPEALPEEEEAEVIQVASQVSDKKITRTSVNVEASKSTTKVTEELARGAESLAKQEFLHTVAPAENLYNISMKYNVKLKALREWNNISEKNKIHVGDKIYVVNPQTVKNINE